MKNQNQELLDLLKVLESITYPPLWTTLE